jgi:hypothetical protein
VEELVREIRNEAGNKTRFPVRFVLVSGLVAWREVVARLRLEADEVLYLSSLCAGDVYPASSQVLKRVKEGNKRKMLVLPLAEYLRLEFERENAGELLRKLAQLPDEGLRRVYIPLLEVREIFLSELERLPRFGKGLLPAVWEVKGEGEVWVTVSPFPIGDKDNPSVTGIGDYLKKWEEGGGSRLNLVTQWARYLEGRLGDFAMEVYPNAYSVLSKKANLWPQSLAEGFGTEGQWRWLAEECNFAEGFFALAARLLNVKEYDPIQMSLRWRYMDDPKKWLAWLWGKLTVSKDSYARYVLEHSSSWTQFEPNLISAILDQQPQPELTRERKNLLEAMGLHDVPITFLEAVAKVNDPLRRLSCLAGITLKEKEMALLAVKELLEGGRKDEDWWPYLELVFPELAWYLTSTPFEDGFLASYFQAYTRSRILDQPSPVLFKMADEAAKYQALWKYPPRDSLLEKALGQDETKILWVDGMGLEWAGAMLRALIHYGNVAITLEVARANLPTLTDVNKRWRTEEEVERSLDRAGHETPYSHSLALVKQLGVVTKVAQKTADLVKNQTEVIITADHGLSRFIQTTGSIRLPEGAQVGKFGRYASVPQGLEVVDQPEYGYLREGDTLVWALHRKFIGGKGATGEVHGGATLEECLVPIFRVKKRRAPLELDKVVITVLTPEVRFNVRNEGKLRVMVDGYQGQVRLRIKNFVFGADHEFGNQWIVVVTELGVGRHRGVLESDDGYLGEVEFKITKGLADQTEDLGL